MLELAQASAMQIQEQTMQQPFSNSKSKSTRNTRSNNNKKICVYNLPYLSMCGKYFIGNPNILRSHSPQYVEDPSCLKLVTASVRIFTFSDDHIVQQVFGSLLPNFVQSAAWLASIS